MCRMQVKSWLELLQILPKDTQLFSVPIGKNTASQPALLSLQGNVIKLGINSFCATTASFLINTLVPKKKEKKSKKCCGWVHRLIKRIIGFKLSQELCSLISKGEKNTLSKWFSMKDSSCNLKMKTQDLGELPPVNQTEKHGNELLDQEDWWGSLPIFLLKNRLHASYIMCLSLLIWIRTKWDFYIISHNLCRKRPFTVGISKVRSTRYSESESILL